MSIHALNGSPFMYIYIFTKNLCNKYIEIVLKFMIHTSFGEGFFFFIESNGFVLNKWRIKIPEAFSFFIVDIDKNSRDTCI